MESIYLVLESGYYSDVSHIIIATFESKDEAVRYCEECNQKYQSMAAVGLEYMTFEDTFNGDDDEAEEAFCKTKNITPEELNSAIHAYYNGMECYVQRLKLGCPCSLESIDKE